MKKLLIVAAAIALMGQGCFATPAPRPSPTPTPVAPAPSCPDVCAAICAGKPEPVVPPGCAMPMCACDQPTPMPESSEQNMPPQAAAPTPAPTPTPAPAPSTSTYNVAIKNFAYAPATITVKKGDKIIFQNSDSMAHTVTSDTGKFDSGNMGQGASYTLDTKNLAPGSYPYHCTPHPFMTGTVIVK